MANNPDATQTEPKTVGAEEIKGGRIPSDESQTGQTADPSAPPPDLLQWALNLHQDGQPQTPESERLGREEFDGARKPGASHLDGVLNLIDKMTSHFAAQASIERNPVQPRSIEELMERRDAAIDRETKPLQESASILESTKDENERFRAADTAVDAMRRVLSDCGYTTQKHIVGGDGEYDYETVKAITDNPGPPRPVLDIIAGPKFSGLGKVIASAGVRAIGNRFGSSVKFRFDPIDLHSRSFLGAHYSSQGRISLRQTVILNSIGQAINSTVRHEIRHAYLNSKAANFERTPYAIAFHIKPSINNQRTNRAYAGYFSLEELATFSRDVAVLRSPRQPEFNPNKALDKAKIGSDLASRADTYIRSALKSLKNGGGQVHFDTDEKYRVRGTKLYLRALIELEGIRLSVILSPKNPLDQNFFRRVQVRHNQDPWDENQRFTQYARRLLIAQLKESLAVVRLHEAEFGNSVIELQIKQYGKDGSLASLLLDLFDEDGL